MRHRYIVYLHFEDGLIVGSELGPLTSNINGCNDIVEDSLLDGCEGAGSGANLDTLTLVISIKDGSLSDEYDVLLGELLLELLNEPSLNLLDGLPDSGGDVDNDALPTGLDLNFLGRVDGNILKITLVVTGRTGLDIEESLSDVKLKSSGSRALLSRNLRSRIHGIQKQRYSYRDERKNQWHPRNH